MPQRNLKVGTIKHISGEVNIAGGDIIQKIKIIYQRALTAVEEATLARELEGKLLAQGVAQLAQNLFAQASEGMESESPYKGLLSYSLKEAEIFYGRSEAKKGLGNCIKQGPLSVLHAESGAGKSSLLQAGIAAQLIADGHLAIYLRPHNADPVDFIKRMFLSELTQTPSLAQVSLREFLRRVCAVLGPKSNLYILLDQFEEFFTLLKKDERQPFLESLTNCLNDPSLRVRWVLSLRAEALSNLAELEAFGIAPFKNLYRLNRLSLTEAKAAMIEPAQRCGITLERALIDHILDTLATHDEVMPTQLQLVCSALTDDLPEDRNLTLAYYTDHEGGTEGILRDYLKRQLEHLAPAEQALAWKVLRVLITADSQRAVKTHDQIYQELKISNTSKKQVDTILRRLAERRLLFNQSTTVETFELAHDYLIQEIELDPQEQARKAAQELLDQETRAYQRHRTLLTAEHLAVIEPYQNELRFSVDAEALLNESIKAVRHEQLVRERLRNITLGISFAVAIAMSLLAIWGIRSSQDARHQAKLAFGRQLAARAQIEWSVNNPVAAGLIALESSRIIETFEANQVLQEVTSYSPELVSYYSHDESVKSLIISPNNRLIASGSDDGVVIIADAKTANIRLKLGYPGHALSGFAFGSSRGTYITPVHSIMFSPDSKFILVYYGDGTLAVWDVNTGQEMVKRFVGKSLSSMHFSPNGEYLILSPVAIWETTNWNELISLKDQNAIDVDTTERIAFLLDRNLILKRMGLIDYQMLDQIPIAITDIDPSTQIVQAYFSEDTKYLVIRLSDSMNTTNEIVLVDLSSNAIVQTWRGNYNSVLNSEINYLTLESDKDLIIWHLEKEKEIVHLTTQAESHASTSHNGSLLAFQRNDGVITLRNLDSGDDRFDVAVGESIYDIAFSDDDRFVVAETWFSNIFINVQTGKITYKIEAPHWIITGNSLYTVSSDSVIRWNLASQHRTITKKSTGSFRYISPNKLVFFSEAGIEIYSNIDGEWNQESTKTIVEDICCTGEISPNGRWVAAKFSRSAVNLADEVILVDILREKKIDIISGVEVHALAFDPVSRYLFVGFAHQNNNKKTSRVLVYSLENSDFVTEFIIDPEDSVRVKIALSPDGNWIAISSRNQITIKSLTNFETERIIETNYAASRINFSPDNKWLLAGSQTERTFDVWETAQFTHRLQVELPWFRDMMFVGFTPDSKHIIAGADDYVTRVYDMGGEIVAQTIQDKQYVYDVIVSPDSLVMATNDRNTIRLWSVQSGQELLKIESGSSIQQVGFSPDGEWLVASSEDGIRFWHYRSNDLANDVCTRVPRNLHVDEWKFVFQSSDYAVSCPNLPVHPSVPVERLETARDLAGQGKIRNAVKLINEVQEDYPDFVINASIWNDLCWIGSLQNYPRDVAFACNHAVQLSPDNGNYHDSRGLNRALMGDYAGAIEDFSYYVDWVADLDTLAGYDVDSRRAWIESLKQGKNPFTSEVMESLRQR